jgi:hypothetical protein
MTSITIITMLINPNVELATPLVVPHLKPLRPGLHLTINYLFKVNASHWASMTAPRTNTRKFLRKIRRTQDEIEKIVQITRLGVYTSYWSIGQGRPGMPPAFLLMYLLSPHALDHPPPGRAQLRDPAALVADGSQPDGDNRYKPQAFGLIM